MTKAMRGAAISRYAEAAAQVGLDPRALLRRLGIDSRLLDEPEMRVPGDKVIDLLQLSAEASGCETFGLRMANLRRLSDYGPIALLLAHQPTMRDTLATLVRYQRMLNESLLIQVQDQPDDLVIVREDLVAAGASPRQGYELAVGTLFRLFSDPAGPRLRPLSVHFAHPAPQDLAYHRQFFGPIVEFDSEFNGMICNRAEFDSISPTADPVLARYAEGFIGTLPYAQHVALAAEVEKAIHILLPFNGASIKSVSARLGLSERTLQRRLAEEDAEFSALLNGIRREHALRYLANVRSPLSEVAALVGYSRETSFARWFASEFGMTPSSWRTSAH